MAPLLDDCVRASVQLVWRPLRKRWQPCESGRAKKPNCSAAVTSTAGRPHALAQPDCTLQRNSGSAQTPANPKGLARIEARYKLVAGSLRLLASSRAAAERKGFRFGYDNLELAESSEAEQANGALQTLKRQL